MNNDGTHYAGPIVSRANAIASNMKRYFTGEACPLGHVAERRVKGRGCVECEKIKAARFREKNPELLNARTREWRASNPEKAAESSKTSWQKRYAAAPEHFRELSRAYRTAHPEKAKARVRAAKPAWVEANPEAAAVYQRNRRAAMRAAGGKHTIGEIRNLAERQKHRCAMCKVSIRSGFHADHITPLSLGGGNGIRNIQLLCAPCNLSKGAKDPLRFARETGRLL